MGEMIGNIAHQWKQPLNNLALNVQEMQYSHRDRPLTDEEMDRGTARSMELISFMSHTIDDFRNFSSSRKQVLKFSLASEVERALAFVASSYQGKGIALSKQVEEDSELEGYPNELTQVLMNILQNAADAFEGKQIATPQVHILVTRRQGRALIIVRDNAGGIEPGMQKRIFDAYATSKENGTGIGLYMSRTIIERSFQGTISAENIDGGAEFRISL
jgi:signal transduction histidine kinase